MTYNEIKRRLTKCEKLCSSLKQQDLRQAPVEVRQEVQKQLKVLNENIATYRSMLLKEEKTYILTPKSGKPSAASLGDDEVEALKDADDIQSIKGADGEEVKEQNDGVTFSVEETKAIAKKVGKAVAMALKALGDGVRTMKAHRIEENSFDIYVEYKNDRDDEFAFHIEGDTLHLADFSFDKELVDVGVKPSGEAIVHVEHLANELTKHFKSLSENVNEVDRSNYTTPKHFDICPGAEALRDELIKGGKSPEELGEWTFLHDELFKLEKAVIKANKADERHIKVAKQFKSEIINLSRDLGIEANKIGYLSGHVKKIEDIASKTDGKGDNVTLMSKDISEGPYQTTYVKVSKRDYRKAISIIDQNIDSTYVTTDIVDDDGAGNVIIYFNFREREEGDFDENPGEFIYDLSMDLEAHGITVTEKSHDLDEATDINDPVLMKSRAMKTKLAKRRADDKMAKAIGDNPYNSRKDSLVTKLKAMRAQIMRDMEQEAEPEGGPIANAYGDKLNKIDAAIAKASGRKKMDYDTAVGKVNENEPTVFDDKSFDALRDIILKYVEDPDDAERAVQQVDDQGLDSLAPELIANLERDPEFEAWYHKLHYGSDADTDYMQRRRAGNDYMEEGEDLDVGHQDDEPSMLKASAFETAEYAAKLVKKLAQYDKHDGEVDFPNWWQKKLILARDYMSAAFHYLDSEEKQPAIDQLALEEGNESVKTTSLKRYKELKKKGIAVKLVTKADLNDKQELKEWGSSDQNIMNQSIHKDLGEPTSMPSPFSQELESAAEDAVDHYWDDWEEYNTDREGLIEHAKKAYLRAYFKETFNKLIQMFSESKGHPSKGHRGGAKKIHKAHSLVVAKMKELAKQYKAGDKSVVPQLKDLTAKKKALEISLDKAVAGTNKHQTLTELSNDQQDAIYDLQSILDDLAQKGDEAREIFREHFPRMLSKGDAYGAFEFGTSANRYDTTLESLIEEIQEYYDEEEEDMDEEYKGKHQGSNYKWPMSKATKDRKEADKVSQSQSSSLIGRLGDKNIKEEMDGGRLFDYFKSKGYDITERRPDGYPPKEGVEGYQVSRGSDRSPQSVIFQHNPSTDQFTISQMSGYRIDQKDAIKAGMRKQGRSYTAGQDYYMTDGNYNPVDISAEGLKDIVDHVMSGLDREAKAQGDFYKDRGHTSGTIDEKAIKEEKSTCCGKCGRKHVKGTKCKTPYLKGKDHCRNK